MSEQVRLNHGADDVYQMRKDWVESFHFDAHADLPGLLDDYDALHAEAEALRETLANARRAMFAVLNQEPRMKAVAKRVLNAEIDLIDRALSAQQSAPEVK
jgi:hypothetical protein